MKHYVVIIIAVFTMSSQMMFGQRYDQFLDAYQYNKKFLNRPATNANDYQEIEGSPYLTSEFIEGTIYLKDSASVKLPLRYNIYTDEMEYQLNGVVYVVGDPQLMKKIDLGGSEYEYLSSNKKGGFFELLVSGKCTLVQKRTVRFKPAEGPKPIEGIVTPAKFIREPDSFYLGTLDLKTIEIATMKSVINILQDQKPKIENFILKEKIRKPTKENLIKIAEYYNGL